MNPVINKFLVALVTVLGAAGVLVSDGVTVQEVIAMVILGFNAIGVYGVSNTTTTSSRLRKPLDVP